MATVTGEIGKSPDYDSGMTNTKSHALTALNLFLKICVREDRTRI